MTEPKRKREIPHGANGYANYKCRCDVCREANRAYVKAARDIKKMSRATCEHPRWHHDGNGRDRCSGCGLNRKAEPRKPIPPVDIAMLQRADAEALESAKAAIDQAIAAVGITQQDASLIAGREATHVNHVLRTNRGMTISTMARLIAACGFELRFEIVKKGDQADAA